MTRVTLGVLLGTVIGVVDVLLMLPLAFPDKRAALIGAFCARFALGFFAAVVSASIACMDFRALSTSKPCTYCSTTPPAPDGRNRL